MDHAAKIEALRKSEIFKELSSSQLNALVPLLREVSLSAGETLFREGDTGRSFFLIVEGEIEILKKDPESNKEIHLSNLLPGEVFGEMALFGDHHRAAIAKAKKSSLLLEVYLKELFHLPHIREIDRRILAKMPDLLAHRVKVDNAAVVASVKRHLEHEKARNALGRFFVNVIVLIFIYIFALRLISSLNIEVISSTIITIPVLILFAISMLLLMKKTDEPWSFYGFTLKGWGRHLVESFFLTLPLLGFILLCKWVIIYLVPSFSKLHLFFVSPALNLNAEPVSSPVFVVLIVAYLFFVPVQEMICRGVMQGILERFLPGAHRKWTAIFVSNLPFSIIHLHLSFSLAVIVYFFGIFWGWMYSRQHSLVGCTFSHLLTGFWGFFIIGVQTVLTI